MALPVSLADARAQLKAEPGEQDEEIQGFIQDAAAWVEQYTGHVLQARNVTEQFRGLGPAELRAWPVADDAAPSVVYYDVNGQPTAVADAELDISRRPARVSFRPGTLWQFPGSKLAYKVSIRAGYESPADVPRNLRRAMLVLIAAYDEDREGGDVLAKAEAAATRLCRGYKVHRV